MLILHFICLVVNGIQPFVDQNPYMGILANSDDSVEMPRDAEFYKCLHYLLRQNDIQRNKYIFKAIITVDPTLCTIMRGSRQFCQRVSNFAKFFFVFMLFIYLFFFG